MQPIFNGQGGIVDGFENFRESLRFLFLLILLVLLVLIVAVATVDYRWSWRRLLLLLAFSDLDDQPFEGDGFAAVQGASRMRKDLALDLVRLKHNGGRVGDNRARCGLRCGGVPIVPIVWIHAHVVHIHIHIHIDYNDNIIIMIRLILNKTYSSIVVSRNLWRLQLALGSCHVCACSMIGLGIDEYRRYYK